MDGEWPAKHFEAHRALLRAVAYRMPGSLSDADDAVQFTRAEVVRPVVLDFLGRHPGTAAAALIGHRYSPLSRMR